MFTQPGTPTWTHTPHSETRDDCQVLQETSLQQQNLPCIAAAALPYTPFPLSNTKHPVKSRHDVFTQKNAHSKNNSVIVTNTVARKDSRQEKQLHYKVFPALLAVQAKSKHDKTKFKIEKWPFLQKSLAHRCVQRRTRTRWKNRVNWTTKRNYKNAAASKTSKSITRHKSSIKNRFKQ